MKYAYYYIWVSLAILHYAMSKMLFPLTKSLFKARKKSEKEQKEWKDDYNKGFLHFPGGMIDWAAYALLVAFVFMPIIVLSLTFKVDIYRSKLYFWSLFICTAAFVYYWIYFKEITWLKNKIGMINKKYYL